MRRKLRPAIKQPIRLEQIPPAADASLTIRDFTIRYFPFTWHYHPEAELTLIIRGRGLRFIGDSIENFREGDLCLLGSNLPHSWQSPDDGGTVRAIVIQFDQSRLIDALQGVAEARGIENLLRQRSRRGLRICGKTTRAVQKNVIEMAVQPHGSMRRFVLLLDCLHLINTGKHESTPISATAMSVHDDHEQAGNLRKVLDRLDESLGDVLPRQSELASMLGITPTAFSRLFKRMVGKNYVDYLNEWRVGLACRRLLETDDAIIDVALSAGFENLSNFHRRFMAIKRMTPGQFRERTRSPALGDDTEFRRTKPRSLESMTKFEERMTKQGLG